MLDEFGNYDPPFEFLWELAQKEQTPDSVWSACDPYKAPLTTVDPSPSEKLSIPLTKDVSLYLSKNPKSDLIVRGQIILCLRRNHAVREQYDQKMMEYCGKGIEAWGYPTFAGTDRDSYEYGYAIWPTVTGYLAIAQTRLDGHVGDDLSIFLGYVEKPLPKRVSTFSDWYLEVSEY